MKIIKDSRRFRIKQISVVEGELVCSSAADIWQGPEGDIRVSGLWDGLIPLTPEDLQIRASRVGVSPLEWLRKKLSLSALVEVEAIGE